MSNPVTGASGASPTPPGDNGGGHGLAVAKPVASPGTPHQEPVRVGAQATLDPTGIVPEAAGAPPGIRDCDHAWTYNNCVKCGADRGPLFYPAYPTLVLPRVDRKMKIAQGSVSAWPNWTTPREFLDVVRALGVIVLDPFWNRASATMPRIAYGPDVKDGPKDSLPVEWCGEVSRRYSTGVIFCNPAYGPFLSKAIPKIIREGVLVACTGLELVSLLPAKTDTRWWHKLATNETAGCFWRGRLSFENPPPGTPGNRPGGANYVSYFGSRPYLFAHVFGPFGIVRVR